MKSLSKGIPLSEYYAIKKMEQEIKNLKIEQKAKEFDISNFIYVSSAITTIVLSIIDSINNPVAIAVSTMGMEKLDSVGTQLLGISRNIGFWVIAITAIYNIIKVGSTGDKKKVGSIVISAVLVYGSMFFVPWALHLVEGIF